MGLWDFLGQFGASFAPKHPPGYVGSAPPGSPLGLIRAGLAKKGITWGPEKIPIPEALQQFLATGVMPYQPAPPITTTTSGVTDTSGLETRNLLNTTMPFITPEYAGLGDLVRKFAEQRLASPTALPRGYVGQGIRGINQSYDAINRSIANRLTASGQAGSPIGVPVAARSDIARGAQTADFLGGLPLTERGLRNEDLSLAQNILAQFGKGTRETQTGTISTKGRSTTSGTSTQTGQERPSIDPQVWAMLVKLLTENKTQPQGGGFGDFLGQALGFLLGSGALTGGAKGTGNFGAGGSLPYVFSGGF